MYYVKNSDTKTVTVSAKLKRKDGSIAIIDTKSYAVDVPNGGVGKITVSNPNTQQNPSWKFLYSEIVGESNHYGEKDQIKVEVYDVGREVVYWYEEGEAKIADVNVIMGDHLLDESGTRVVNFGGLNYFAREDWTEEKVVGSKTVSAYSPTRGYNSKTGEQYEFAYATIDINGGEPNNAIKNYYDRKNSTTFSFDVNTSLNTRWYVHFYWKKKGTNPNPGDSGNGEVTLTVLSENPNCVPVGGGKKKLSGGVATFKDVEIVGDLTKFNGWKIVSGNITDIYPGSIKLITEGKLAYNKLNEVTIDKDTTIIAKFGDMDRFRFAISSVIAKDPKDIRKGFIGHKGDNITLYGQVDIAGFPCWSRDNTSPGGFVRDRIQYDTSKLTFLGYSWNDPLEGTEYYNTGFKTTDRGMRGNMKTMKVASERDELYHSVDMVLYFAKKGSIPEEPDPTKSYTKKVTYHEETEKGIVSLTKDLYGNSIETESEVTEYKDSVLRSRPKFDGNYTDPKTGNYYFNNEPGEYLVVQRYELYIQGKFIGSYPLTAGNTIKINKEEYVDRLEEGDTVEFKLIFKRINTGETKPPDPGESGECERVLDYYVLNDDGTSMRNINQFTFDRPIDTSDANKYVKFSNAKDALTDVRPNFTGIYTTLSGGKYSDGDPGEYLVLDHYRVSCGSSSKPFIQIKSASVQGGIWSWKSTGDVCSDVANKVAKGDTISFWFVFKKVKIKEGDVIDGKLSIIDKLYEQQEDGSLKCIQEISRGVIDNIPLNETHIATHIEYDGYTYKGIEENGNIVSKDDYKFTPTKDKPSDTAIFCYVKPYTDPNGGSVDVFCFGYEKKADGSIVDIDLSSYNYAIKGLPLNEPYTVTAKSIPGFTIVRPDKSGTAGIETVTPTEEKPNPIVFFYYFKAVSEPGIPEPIGEIVFDPYSTQWTNQGKYSEGNGAYRVRVYYTGESTLTGNGKANIHLYKEEVPEGESNPIIWDYDEEINYSVTYKVKGIRVYGDATGYIDGTSGYINITTEGKNLQLFGELIWGEPEEEEIKLSDYETLVSKQDPDKPKTIKGSSGYYNLDWTTPTLNNISSTSTYWTNKGKPQGYPLDFTLYEKVNGSGFKNTTWIVEDSSYYNHTQQGKAPEGQTGTHNVNLKLKDGMYYLKIHREDIANTHTPKNEGSNIYGEYLIDLTDPDEAKFEYPDAVYEDGTYEYMCSFNNEIKVTIGDNLSGIEETRYLWTQDEGSNINSNLMTKIDLTKIVSGKFTTNDRNRYSSTFTLNIHDNLVNYPKKYSELKKGKWYLYIYQKDRAGNIKITKSNPIFINKIEDFKLNFVHDIRWQNIFQKESGTVWDTLKKKYVPMYKRNGKVFNVSDMPLDESYNNEYKTNIKEGYFTEWNYDSFGFNNNNSQIDILITYYYWDSSENKWKQIGENPGSKQTYNLFYETDYLHYYPIDQYPIIEAKSKLNLDEYLKAGGRSFTKISGPSKARDKFYNYRNEIAQTNNPLILKNTWNTRYAFPFARVIKADNYDNVTNTLIDRADVLKTPILVNFNIIGKKKYSNGEIKNQYYTLYEDMWKKDLKYPNQHGNVMLIDPIKSSINDMYIELN